MNEPERAMAAIEGETWTGPAEDPLPYPQGRSVLMS
jgi:hypothetical protein